MQYGGLFQTGNENSGGWRYGFENRPTSNAALQQVAPIDPEFLKKVAGMKPEEKKGLLDAALTAQPLQGLLDTGGAPGSEPTFGGGGASSETFGTSPGGNMTRNDSGAGFNVNAKGLGALGQFGMSGNPLALAGLLGNVSQTAPVQSIVAPGLNGYISNAYGTDPALTGAPNAAQAQALADQLARELAGYQGGSIGGDGGYGGFGGMTGGDGSMGFGGEY